MSTAYSSVIVTCDGCGTTAEVTARLGLLHARRLAREAGWACMNVKSCTYGKTTRDLCPACRAKAKSRKGAA